jgi:hypothetical protein
MRTAFLIGRPHQRWLRNLDRFDPELGMRLTLLLFMVFGACGTAPAVAQSRATYATVKEPQAVAACLQDTFGPVALVRTGNRISIISRDDRPKLSVRIYDNGTVEVLQPLPLEGEPRSSIESCTAASSQRGN